MARKVTPKHAAKAPQAPGAEDVAIMHPEREITLAGRTLTVREYGFVDGLRLRAQTRPFVLALEQLFQDGEGLTDDVLAVVGEHYDLVRLAIARSAGVEIEWIESLQGHDAEALLGAWWDVCGPFFVGQLLRRLKERMQRQELFAGRTSMPNSPMPATAPPSSSAATPNGSSDSSTSA